MEMQGSRKVTGLVDARWGDAARSPKPKRECFRGIEPGVTWYWEERW